MQWHLLNQLCVNLGPLNLEDSVLEELVSSELLLVQVLASVMGYLRITSLEDQELCSPIEVDKELLS